MQAAVSQGNPLKQWNGSGILPIINSVFQEKAAIGIWSIDWLTENFSVKRDYGEYFETQTYLCTKNKVDFKCNFIGNQIRN